MRIINLVENTQGPAGCAAEHGLCFYVETKKHTLLVDTGATDLFVRNAEHLGLDLRTVDTVVLTHGHYDHGGGLPEFLKINSKARVYMQKSAFGELYGIDSEDAPPRYIGLDQELKESSRIIFAEGDLKIDEELFIFSGIGDELPAPSGNRALHIQTENGMIRDDFRHEQCLVVSQEGKKILFSGCAHHGILNILARYRLLYHKDPDAVISGFHMMRKNGYSKEDFREIVHTAYELKKLKTKFFTCHCTGTVPYEAMKKIMGSRLEYVQCGDEITIIKSKKGAAFMKYHKFFAWATVFCFVMTMVTGYRKK